MHFQPVAAVTEFSNEIHIQSLFSLEDWCLDEDSVFSLSFNGFGHPLEWNRISSIRRLAEREQLMLRLKGNQYVTLPSDCPCIYAVKVGSIALHSMTPNQATWGALLPSISHVLDQEFERASSITFPDYGEEGLKTDMPLDYHLGYAMGLAFESNNTVTDTYTSTKALRLVLPPGLHKHFIEHARHLYTGFKPKFSRRDSELIWHCRYLASLFKIQIGEKEDSHLPRWLFSGPEEFRTGFFDGLLEYRISFTKDQKLNAEFNTKNQLLAYEIRWLAASVKVGATIRPDRSLHRVRFRSNDLANKGGNLVDPARYNILSSTFSANSLDRSDIVPISSQLVRTIKRMMTPSDRSGRTALNKALKTGYVTRSLGASILDRWGDQLMNEPDGRQWKEIVDDTRIAWSPIEEANELSPEETLLPAIGNGCTNWITADGLLLAPAPDIVLQRKIGS